MNNHLDFLTKIGLLPFCLLERAEDATALADALIKAGVPCLELEYNAAAEKAFKRLAAERPDFITAARVCTAQDAAAAQAAGARFVTGDVSFAALDLSVLPGGRVILPEELVRGRNWAQITRLVNGALLRFLDFGLRHVGINSRDEAESSATSSAFERIFGFAKEDRGGAYFAGDIIEVMKKPFYGEHGHIAISTANAACAARYLEACGVALNWASAGYNPDGRLRVVYLQDEIGGFAVHILQK